MTWDPQHPVNNLEQGCWGINPKVAFEEPFDLESRQFYKELDTTLVFKGRLVITGANIIYLRKKFLKELEKIAAVKHKNISKV